MKSWKLSVVVASLIGAGAAEAQTLPDKFKNLQVLNKNITQRELKALMEGFTDQLGVKCTYCHILDEYEKDERPHKADARKMIQLVHFMRANKAKYFKPDANEALITCGTCHRGKAEVEEFVP